MNENDPRHGSVAGYIAEGRANLPRCPACHRAWIRYDKRRKLMGGYTVPTARSQRQIQALHAIGWSRKDISEACGYESPSALKTIMAHPTMTIGTATKIAAAYKRLHMTPGSNPKSNWWRREAKRRGWHPPLAWDDIDRGVLATYLRKPSKEVCQTSKEADPVVIERILAGDVPASISKDEKAAAAAEWARLGRSLADLERLTGWKVERYHKVSEVAA